MAILKAGTYVFKAVPALASSLVQSEFTYKTYDLTNNDIYTTEPRTYLFMGSNMQSSDTKNIAIVKMTNSPGATEWSEKTYEAARGWYRFYYNGDFDSVTDRYTATDTTKFRTIIVESDQTVDDAFYTWFMTNIEKPQVNIDFTTLSGYESLSAGTYALSVKAKAAGYQDSDLSQTVSFTKLAAPVATAADTTVTWDAITNADSYDVYVDGELYENTTGGVTYNITTIVTNGTYSGDTTITDTATVTITANSGYTLPDTVTVTGASKTWNKETGTLTLTNPTGAVAVSAVCVKTTYTLKFTGGNSPMSGTLNGETIERYTEYTLKNGDVITLKAAGSEDHYLVDHYYKGNVIIDDVTYSNNSTITIKNKDIYATSTLTSSSSNISTTITINFVIE